MKHLLTATIILFLSSCSNAFINHKLKATKIGACSNDIKPIKITSNIMGERYEFEYCLDENFDEKNYTVTRKGDSLLVQFSAAAKPAALYKIIIDIDAKPGYSYITLGDRTIAVTTAAR